MLAALTPPDIQVSICDENLGLVDFEDDVDVVGITVVTQTATRAYQVADAFRAKGTKVVLGGIHPSVVPEEASEHADAVVIGEAEYVWADLCRDYQQGQLKPVYRSQKLHPLTNLLTPRRALFAQSGYVIRNTISTTRGCPFDCSFCSISAFYGRTYRRRPVEEVIQEVSAFDPRDGAVFFVDDNIVGSPEWAKQLFRVLIPLKLDWFSQGSISMGADHELLELAAASGCKAMFIGFESISQQSLSSVGKKVNTVADYRQLINAIQSHGIAVLGAFMFGMDSDDETIFERTVDFTKQVRMEGAQFNILTPFPGTPLRQKLLEEKRVLTDDWSQYDGAHVVFDPKLMSLATLQQGHDWAWREFYSLGSIWQRLGLRRFPLIYLLNLNFYRHWK
jgi:radical SAM superfamily enzyme YgiQ (UPF0313 family)